MPETHHYCGRFAPSPTGPLHMGSLVTALASWWHARQHRGRWLLRIEDIDPPREVAGAAISQIECLKRFELVSDEAIWHQSQRSERYQEALTRLQENGHIFECYCSRGELAEWNGIHRKCVIQRTQSRFSLRLKMPEVEISFVDEIQGEYRQNLGQRVGDVVLKRADGLWAYHLAAVVDDADQGVTHIVRGADLLDSTPRQMYLQQCICLPSLKYAHLPLVLDAAGGKLSKSELSVPIDAEDRLSILKFAWKHLGQNPEIMSGVNTVLRFHRLALEHFAWRKVPRVQELSMQ
jgi:glutamyl-Q tRNA(Asp) synthetase